MVTRLVCFEVCCCFFFCGQLGVILADHRSVIFALANIAEQVLQCGGRHDLIPLTAGGLLVCCTFGCVGGLIVPGCFFAILHGVDGSRLS